MRIGLKPGDIILAVNGRKVAKVGDLQNATGQRGGSWDSHHPQATRKPARCVSAREGRAGDGHCSNAQAPRPLADRLRPKRLEEIVGQQHLLAADAPIGRMVASGHISSMILWGPPGCGKTTLARLLAEHTHCISSRSPRCSPASPICARRSRRRGAPDGGAGARCSSSTRSTASTAPSRTASCPMSRTARSSWSARRRRTRPSS